MRDIFPSNEFKRDFLLVYTLEGEDLLIFERLGTHAEIFGL